MTVEQIVTVIALIVGPLLAVGITLLAQRLANIRNERLWVFQTLMAYRSDPFNSERIKALALIDVSYRKVPAVRNAWKEYYDALNDPKYKDSPNAFEVWRRKQNEMLAEMAQALGYGKDIKYGEIDRVYAPILFANNAMTAQQSATEWLRVLKNSENLGTPRSDSDDGENPHA